MTDYAVAWYKWFPVIENAAGDLTHCMLERAGLAPGHRVLDLATGIGEPALTAARRVGMDGLVLGVDISTAMIHFARERAEAAGLTNAEFQVMDIEVLPLSGAFDMVLCRWGLMFVDDLPGTLSRVYDVLRPGGRLSVSVWASADETPTLSLAERVVRHSLGLPPPDEGVKTPFALCNMAALLATLESAGFDEVDVERVPVTFEFTSPEDFVTYREEVSSRFMEAIAGQGEKDRRAALQAVGRAVEPYQDHTGTVRMDNYAYCLSATRP